MTGSAGALGTLVGALIVIDFKNGGGGAVILALICPVNFAMISSLVTGLFGLNTGA
jgi:hypothetical protein